MTRDLSRPAGRPADHPGGRPARHTTAHDDAPAVDWASAYRYLEDELRSALLAVAGRMEALEAEVAAAGRTTIRSVGLERLESGRVKCIIAADGADLRYAFYVYRDDVLVREQPYGRSNTLEWGPDRSGAYRVRGFIRRGAEKDPAATRVSPTVSVVVP